VKQIIKHAIVNKSSTVILRVFLIPIISFIPVRLRCDCVFCCKCPVGKRKREGMVKYL